MDCYSVCITLLAAFVLSASCLPVEVNRVKREGLGTKTGVLGGAVAGGLVGGPIGAAVGAVVGGVAGHELHKVNHPKQVAVVDSGSAVSGVPATAVAQ